jgi:putative addiction module CopG family antidote
VALQGTACGEVGECGVGFVTDGATGRRVDRWGWQGNGRRARLRVEGESMATRSFGVTAEFEEFVAEQVKSGRFADAREVLEAAKAALAREATDDDLDVEYVRQAIEEGEASGIYEGDVFADIRKKYGLTSSL